MFENLKGGWQAGEVKKNCNNADKKNLNKNVLNNLSRDNLLQNIKPGKTYSIEIKKKRRRKKRPCPILFWRKFPSG